jgi:uncharacterized protein (TIGR00369 family)
VESIEKQGHDAMSKLSNLEFFKLVAADGEAPAAESRFIYPPAIAKTLGFKLIEVGPGTATMEIVVDTDKHANPMGTIHGGVLCDIADAAIGTAHATSLEAGESFTSLDLQINFFRPGVGWADSRGGQTCECRTKD